MSTYKNLLVFNLKIKNNVINQLIKYKLMILKKKVKKKKREKELKIKK
jgi:hypothetical protein